MAATTIKDGFAGGSDNQLKVNADGSINVTSGGGGSSNVNIHDSSGGTLNSTAGALNVDLVTPLPAGTNAIGSITNTSFQVTQATGANLHVDVDNFPATQPVSGTVTVVQPTGTNLHTVIDSGTITTITNPVTVTGTVAATQSGTWNINNVSGTVSLPTGASTSANQSTEIASLATIVTNTNGMTVSQGSTTSGEVGPLSQGAVTTAAPTYTTGNTNPLSLTTAGALRTDASATTQPVSGTVTANQGGAWTVTANAGTNLNTSALALDTSVNGILVSQGSTTSGEKGPLIQGAVTTAAPAYTTAQTSPLSLTTAGALRTDSSASTQPISGTVAATQSGTWTVQPGNTANTTPWLTTINQGGNSASVSASNALKVDGSAVTQPVSGTVTANAGTGTFTVGQSSGANLHVNVDNFPASQSATQGTSPWVDNITQFGSTNISTGTGASGAGIPRVTVSNDSKVQAWDGTNTTTVKAASTASIATDTALVVALSPNSPVPAGTNTIGTVLSAPAQGTLTDGSNHVTTPGVFQTVFAANANRKYLMIQNIDTQGGYLYVDFGGSPTVSRSFILGPVGMLVMEDGFVSTEAVSVDGTTTVDFCAKQG